MTLINNLNTKIHSKRENKLKINSFFMLFVELFSYVLNLKFYSLHIIN